MIVIKQLVWTDWNVAHIAQHDVIPDEVEQACKGRYISYESYAGRFEVIGETHKGRIVLVVLDPEPEDGVYFVVTAHTAEKKDRALYRKERGGEKAA
jgi:hypothetical protein